MDILDIAEDSKGSGLEFEPKKPEHIGVRARKLMWCFLTAIFVGLG